MEHAKAIALADRLMELTLGEQHEIAAKLRAELQPGPTLEEILAKIPGDTHMARSKRLGVSYQAYTNWRNGAVPRLPFAKKIARLTGHTVAEIRGKHE